MVRWSLSDQGVLRERDEEITLLTKAAVLFEAPGKWEVVELELEGPRQGELLIKMGAAGLCHSDDHILTGDLPVPPGALPVAGGHEGAGVVEEVGPNTPGWQVGERVVLTFLPMCGTCRWCASGMQNLCDNGRNILSGVREDGSRRMTSRREAARTGGGCCHLQRMVDGVGPVGDQVPRRCAPGRRLPHQLRSGDRLGVGRSVRRRPTGRRGHRDGNRRDRDERRTGRRSRGSLDGHRRRPRRNEAIRFL